jgi:dipeptidyl-peptidase-4
MMQALLRSALVVVLVALLPAQADPSRLDAGRVAGGEFAAARFGPARWLDGAHYATLEPAADGATLELVRFEAVTGARSVLVGADRLARKDRPAIVVEDYVFAPGGALLLVFTESERVWRQNTRGEFYVLDLAGARPPQRLGGDLPKGSLQFAKWSPDGRRVAGSARCTRAFACSSLNASGRRAASCRRAAPPEARQTPRRRPARRAFVRGSLRAVVRPWACA